MSGCRIINGSISWLDTRTAGRRHYPLVKHLNRWVLERSIIAIHLIIHGTNLSELDDPSRRPEDEGINQWTGTECLCLCGRRPSVFIQRPMDRVSYARRREPGLSSPSRRPMVFGSNQDAADDHRAGEEATVGWRVQSGRGIVGRRSKGRNIERRPAVGSRAG